MIVLTENLFGYPIRCETTKLDHGIHVLLTGGCRTHIGAVTLAQPGAEPETHFLPGHKDQFVSEPWARALADRTGEPACVICGIHYHRATKAQISRITETTDKMLEQLLQSL